MWKNARTRSTHNPHLRLSHRTSLVYRPTEEAVPNGKGIDCLWPGFVFIPAYSPGLRRVACPFSHSVMAGGDCSRTDLIPTAFRVSPCLFSAATPCARFSLSPKLPSSRELPSGRSGRSASAEEGWSHLDQSGSYCHADYGRIVRLIRDLSRCADLVG